MVAAIDLSPARYIAENGKQYPVKRAYVAEVSFGATDDVFLDSLTAAPLTQTPGLKFRILWITVICQGVAGTFQVNSKGTDSGTPIGATFSLAANGGYRSGVNLLGEYETNVGEMPTITTSNPCSCEIGYVEVPG